MVCVETIPSGLALWICSWDEVRSHGVQVKSITASFDILKGELWVWDQ